MRIVAARVDLSTTIPGIVVDIDTALEMDYKGLQRSWMGADRRRARIRMMIPGCGL